MNRVHAVLLLAFAFVSLAVADYHFEDEDEHEEPIQVVIKPAGPSQTFEWLGNGHDEHIHPRPPPLRPIYLFMGRPDFVVNYVARNQHSSGASQHHHQPLPSYAQPALQQAHGRNQQGHGHGHGHSQPAASAGQQPQSHLHAPPAPSAGTQPGKVFDPVTPLYSLPGGSAAPVGIHPLPPPPPPLVGNVKPQEHQYPPYEVHKLTNGEGQHNQHSIPSNNVQIDDPNAQVLSIDGPELLDEVPGEVTENPLGEDDIVTAAVAEHSFEETHQGAASSSEEVKLLPPKLRGPPTGFQAHPNRASLYVVAYDE